MQYSDGVKKDKCIHGNEILLNNEPDCWKCMDDWSEEMAGRISLEIGLDKGMFECDSCGLRAEEVFLAGKVNICRKCIEYLNRVSDTNGKDR